MASGDQINAEENVVRALVPPYWDPELGRGTPSAFAQEEVSVSRTAVTPLDNLVGVLRANIERPVDHPRGELRIAGLALVQVSAVLDAASENADIALTVIEDPEPGNPAHALIRCTNSTTGELRKLTRGVAKRICDSATHVPL